MKGRDLYLQRREKIRAAERATDAFFGAPRSMSSHEPVSNRKARRTYAAKKRREFR